MGRRYWKRLLPLGELRCRVLACLFANEPSSPCHFDPSMDADLRQECRRHFERLLEDSRLTLTREQRDTEIALVTAGLLTYGQIDRANDLLDNLTPHFETDHGCGWCVLLPMVIFCTVLPLSEDICECSFAGGNMDIVAARRWLDANRPYLVWDDTGEKFVLTPSATGNTRASNDS